MKLLTKLSQNSIVKASLGIFIITFLVKGIGYAEKLILAYYFGTSPESDAFNVVSSAVLSVFVFFREMIEPGFLNSFLTAQNNNERSSAWNIFNLFGRITLFATILTTLVVELFPVSAIDFFAPGFHGVAKDTAIAIIKIAFPASIFLALSSLTNITLNASKKFVFPASADILFRGITVLFLLILTPFIGIYSAGIGLLIGAFGKLLVHLSALYQNISFRRITLPKSQRDNIIKLTWPLLLGVSFSQFNVIIDNVFASYLDHGVISSLSYAKKIVELPILIFPYILSTVLFPFFSESIIKGESGKMQSLLFSSLKWVVIIFIPISVFFIMYAHPIVAIVFKRGAFDEASTLLTVKPFVIYAVGMLFFAVETILVVYFYANSHTLLPILIGMGCVMINILITYLTIGTLGYQAIPLAYVISKSLKVIILLSILFLKNGIHLGKVFIFTTKVILSSLLFYILQVAFIYLLPFNYNSIIFKLAHMGAACFIAFTIYFFSIYKWKLLQPVMNWPKSL